MIEAAENPFQGAAAGAFQEYKIPVPHITVNGGLKLIHTACMKKAIFIKRSDGSGGFFPVEEHHVSFALRQKASHAFVSLFGIFA